MLKDSKIQPSAKSVGALLRAGLHPSNERGEFFMCGGKTSDLHKTEEMNIPDQRMTSTNQPFFRNKLGSEPTKGRVKGRSC